MSRNLSNIISFETFRSEGKEWKHFGKILFFLLGLPLLLLLLVLEIDGWFLGETVPFPRAAEEQANSPDLIWKAGRQQNYAYFKMARVARERPDILIMGDSTAGQFRSAMFRPYSCYNLSRVSWPISTYSDLLNHLPAGYAPKVIVFNLNFMMFSSAYDESYADVAPVFGPPDHLDSLADLFRDLRANPMLVFRGSRGHFPNETVMGLTAQNSLSGFRKDGSELWPVWQMEDLRGSPETLGKLEPNVAQFSRQDRMGTRELAQFEEFVSLAHAKGIALIGVQMPIYGPVLRALEDDPRCGILKGFRAHVAEGYFDRLNVIFFDELSFPPYSDDYRYFITSVHPTEAVASAILLKMAADPRVKSILPHLDTAALQLKLDEDAAAQEHVFLYGNEF